MTTKTTPVEEWLSENRKKDAFYRLQQATEAFNEEMQNCVKLFAVAVTVDKEQSLVTVKRLNADGTPFETAEH